jgi:hypothetical protein
MRPVLIDTDILSHFFRNHTRVISHFREYLVNHDTISLSIITYYEVLSGLKYYLKGGRPQGGPLQNQDQNSWYIYYFESPDRMDERYLCRGEKFLPCLEQSSRNKRIHLRSFNAGKKRSEFSNKAGFFVEDCAEIGAQSVKLKRVLLSEIQGTIRFIHNLT